MDIAKLRKELREGRKDSPVETFCLLCLLAIIAILSLGLIGVIIYLCPIPVVIISVSVGVLYWLYMNKL